MRELTQTNLDPGNCWQTCIACILDLDPEELPSQVDHDMRRVVDPDGTARWVGRGYGNVIGTYLRKHHRLFYLQLHHPPEVWSALQIRPDAGLHMMTGTTVRTATNGARHVVVGEGGKLRWDPHPSRAGLLGDVEHAFLVPFPPSYAEYWDKRAAEGDACLCRSCASQPSSDKQEVKPK